MSVESNTLKIVFVEQKDFDELIKCADPLTQWNFNLRQIMRSGGLNPPPQPLFIEGVKVMVG